MTKARIRIQGNLAIIVTSQGQKAVVPLHVLCETLQRFNLQPENHEIRCAKKQKNIKTQITRIHHTAG